MQFTSVALPGLWLLLFVAGQSFAQGLDRGAESYTLPPGSMPAWTVPVLRLVSATHVEPTTGVVISDSGLVLVPGNFAGPGEEIIVLDGGTDIVRNGRPARIEKKFIVEGLQVLSVEGLKRQGVALAARPLESGQQVTLTAFPPAEQIAQGEPPLSVQASIVVSSEGNGPAVSDETPLPNVTGALVNRCGGLVGFSLADDVQTMEASPATRYRWRDALLRVLAEMQVVPRQLDCQEEPEAEPEDSVDQAAPAVEEEPAQELQREETPEPESGEEQTVEPTPEPVVEELPPEILPPLEEDTVEIAEPAEQTSPGGWVWLLAAAVLMGLGFVLHRLRRSGKEGPEAETGHSNSNDDPPVDTPEDEPPAVGTALDSTLLISGMFENGVEFEDSCAVSDRAINIVIGRGDADLVIHSAAVSRRHACLNGTSSELTVSDLGSSNGTSINGVPCLEGEIMYIEPGDILILGDARCSLEIRPRREAGTDKA